MKKRQSEFRSVTKIILISIKLGCSSERENRINGYFAKFILIMIIKISHHEASWLSLCTDLEKKIKIARENPPTPTTNLLSQLFSDMRAILVNLQLLPGESSDGIV